MEDRFQVTANGQAVLQTDLNLLGETSSLADDRVFAELFRMQPYDGSTVRKGVLPYRHAASGTAGLLAANGASGSVLVSPFRAFVGTRTAVGSDAKKNWRDVRSAICVGTTTLAQSVSITANASGNPRWDLVYAAVVVDGNTASVTRKVKDPTTKAIAGSSLVTRLATTVTLSVVAGTAAASPVWPSIPADSGSTYNVPIAYVRVPNGFGAGSTVLGTDIAVVAPCLGLSGAVGGATLSPATESVTLPTPKQQAWGSTGTRPGRFMPSTLGGGQSVLLYLDLADASSANWSHASGDTLDSRDWRGRYARWQCQVVGAPETSNKPYTTGSGFQTNTQFPGDGMNGVDAAGNVFDQTLQDLPHGMGHSMGAGSGGKCTIVGLDDDRSSIGAGATLHVYVDASDGKIKFTTSGSPLSRFLIWIDFTGVFENVG